MHKAFKNLFEGRAGFPTFRKKGQNDAFRYPDAKQIRIEEDRIFLPKAGLTEMVMHRPIVGTVKNVTVSVGRSWFASCNACDTVDAASRISRYRFVCTTCG